MTASSSITSPCNGGVSNSGAAAPTEGELAKWSDRLLGCQSALAQWSDVVENVLDTEELEEDPCLLWGLPGRALALRLRR